MKLGVLQMNSRFGDVEGNIIKAVGMLEALRDATVVLPELFPTGYVFRDRDEVRALAEPVRGGYTVSRLKPLARRRRLTLVFGLAEAAGGRLFNSAVCLTPDGKTVCYRKAHLFDDEKRLFDRSPGPFRVWGGGGVRLGLMICFDWIFPEVARILTLRGAQVILHPSNLVLPWCQDAMRTRAIENRVFIATANRTGRERRAGRSLEFTGKSQIVSPAGKVLVRMGSRAEGVVCVDIDPHCADDKRPTPSNHILMDRRVDLYSKLVGGKAVLGRPRRYSYSTPKT